MSIEKFKIDIVGLDCVSPPLAALIGKKYNCIGFDISEVRVSELRVDNDRTGELSNSYLYFLYTSQNITHRAEL